MSVRHFMMPFYKIHFHNLKKSPKSPKTDNRGACRRSDAFIEVCERHTISSELGPAVCMVTSSANRDRFTVVLLHCRQGLPFNIWHNEGQERNMHWVGGHRGDGLAEVKGQTCYMYTYITASVFVCMALWSQRDFIFQSINLLYICEFTINRMIVFFFILFSLYNFCN